MPSPPRDGTKEPPPRALGVPTAPPEFGPDRIRQARTLRRIMLGVLAVFVLLGAATVLGARSGTASGAGGGYRLRLDYPAMSRPGLAVRWILTVTHPGGFDHPVQIATTSRYFDLFDFNNLDPTPSGVTSDGATSVWTFDPPTGDTLTVTLDARVEPAQQLGKSAATSLLVRGRPVVTLTYRTRLMP